MSGRAMGRVTAACILGAVAIGMTAAPSGAAQGGAIPTGLRWDSPRVLHTRSATYRSIDPCPAGAVYVEIVVTFRGGAVGNAWPNKIAADGSWRVHEPLGIAGAPRGPATISAGCNDAHGALLASYATHGIDLEP